MSVVDRIRSLIEPALAPLVVDEVKVTPAGRRRVVRIAVDRATDETVSQSEPTDPMSLDEVAEATRVVSAALDDTDILGEQPYTLEVTSSGVGRPLTRPRHYQRGIGRLVIISRADAPDTRGRILAAGPDDVTISIAATKREPARTETIAYADIAGARIDVEFSRAESDA
ncbi:ribosome maturation factor RimP [Nostocoides sp. F2B08]|uniref:ribosome maturation factor RimP n=1 Tax=Nostocoides sp. F2B08 TaxID=2653936 RepID=UPI001262DCA7|nr:ribosome maturation factor RimP [Tetrasphaera sp. F2B08]KAB7746007.1 ribosome maturation factor RimP [Tetrasphaera sp. F2B08]